MPCTAASPRGVGDVPHGLVLPGACRDTAAPCVNTGKQQLSLDSHSQMSFCV